MNKADFEKLSREDTAALLTRLKEEGDSAEILRYFYYTMQRPYLCKSSAPKDVLPEEEYVAYFFKATAALALNNSANFFSSLLNSLYTSLNYLQFSRLQYEGCANFLDMQGVVKEATTPEAYKALIPRIDEYAGTVEGFSSFLDYTPGEGTYTLNPRAFFDTIKPISETVADLAQQLKEALEAAKQTISVVGDDIRPLLDDSVAAYFGKVPEAIEEVLTELRAAAFLYTNPLPLPEEARDKYPAADDFTALMKATPADYSSVPTDPRNIKIHLINYAGNSTYILAKVEENKSL